MGADDFWYGYKFCRSQLTEQEKGDYDRLYQGIKAHEKTITLSRLSSGQYTGLLDAVLADNPMFYHVQGFSVSCGLLTCVVQPVYSMSEEEHRAWIPQLETRAGSCLRQVHAVARTKWQQVRALHDAMVAGITYEETGPQAHSVLGPLCSRRGVCEGIAKTVKLLCDRAGIESIIITGTALSNAGKDREAHAWNAIKLDSGWHYFDFTYDLTLTRNNPCRLVRYDYFALSLDEISADHSAPAMKLPPASSSENYFARQGWVVRDRKELRALLGRVVSASQRDAAFRVSRLWRGFSPDAELRETLPLRAMMTQGLNMAYSFTYNDLQRVCYVHFGPDSIERASVSEVFHGFWK